MPIWSAKENRRVLDTTTEDPISPLILNLQILTLITKELDDVK